MVELLVSLAVWSGTGQQMTLASPVERIKSLASWSAATPAREIVLSPADRIEIGMAQKEVEKVLGETHQGMNIFGPWGMGAFILCEYPKNRISIQYDDLFRVVSVSRPVPAPKPDNTPADRIKVGMTKATVEEILGEKTDGEGFSYTGVWNAVSAEHRTYPKNRVSITYDATGRVTQIWKSGSPAPEPNKTPAKPER